MHFETHRVGRLPRGHTSVTRQLGICSSGKLVCRSRLRGPSVTSALLRFCGKCTDALEPHIQRTKREFALHSVPFLAITDLSLQSWKQVKCDVCRLEVPGIRLCHVVNQRTKCSYARRRNRFKIHCQCRGMNPGHEPRCNGFYVPFNPADLSRKKNVPILLHLQALTK